MSFTNIQLLQFKIKVTNKNADFDCWYIGTYTEEKPSEISNIEDGILRSSHQNAFAILSTLESTLYMESSDALQNASF